MKKKQKDFRVKYVNGKIITKEPNGLNHIKILLQMPEKRSNVELHLDTLKAKLKRYQTRKLHGIQEFLFLKFISVHDRLATKMNK